MNQNRQHILVTGGAGFIGSHVVERLLGENYLVTVIDNFDAFYPKEIKLRNMEGFIQNPDLKFFELDILDSISLEQKLTDDYDGIIHLAAKAGVRPSIENPVQYQNVNVAGTQNMLELARKKNIKQFVFASSSSVYGINKNVPWSESDLQLFPISPYASTKISGELLGHVYSHLYGIRFIALRFFTVFGPRQRPDLAIHAFAKKILKEQSLNFFGDGSTKRDYTYVSDTVEGVFNALHYQQSNYEIFNLGNNNVVSLSEMLNALEQVLEKKAIINKMPEQIGDVSVTYANIGKAQQFLNYQPSTPFEEGIIKFKEWLMVNE
jgi:UDP-glucuronate 4-epimerase